MEIIKNGKRNSGAFKFTCDKCNCRFKADVNDYRFMVEGKYEYMPSRNNTPSDVIEVHCPNCGNKIWKHLYRSDELNISGAQVFYGLNAVLDLCTVGYIISMDGNGDNAFSVLLGFLFILLTLLNTAFAICGWDFWE